MMLHSAAILLFTLSALGAGSFLVVTLLGSADAIVGALRMQPRPELQPAPPAARFMRVRYAARLRPAADRSGMLREAA